MKKPIFKLLALITLSTLGTFCTTPTAPPEIHPQIEVKGPITEDTVWESGKGVKKL